MNNNELSLDVARSHDLKIMRLFDTSNYCDDESLENYLIEVLPVNKSSWITFLVQKNFSLTLNSSNLRYKQVSDSAALIDLPDGIYEFKQSYKPNIHTLVHFYHLRTVALTFKYVELLCKHFNEECKKDERTYNAETLQLAKIKQYIDAAEFMVNENHNKECGIRYYNQAVELIKQFENECGC